MKADAPKARPHFAYDKEARAAAQTRHARMYEFEGAIQRAHKRDTGSLCNYLRSDLPLLEDHREALAGLIERLIQHKSVGHPRGGSTYQPALEAELQIIHRCEKDLAELRKLFGSPLPKGAIDEVLEKRIHQASEDGDLHGLDVRFDNMRKALLRGPKKKKKRAK